MLARVNKISSLETSSTRPSSIVASHVVGLGTSVSRWHVIGLGTSVSRWHSYARVIHRCWWPICTVLDDETTTCSHCNGAKETTEHLILHCPAHNQAQWESWSNLHYQSNPRCLWSFMVRIGGVTPPPRPGMRQREQATCTNICIQMTDPPRMRASLPAAMPRPPP